MRHVCRNLILCFTSLVLELFLICIFALRYLSVTFIAVCFGQDTLEKDIFNPKGFFSD